MRMIPGLVVIDPCDATEIAAGDRGDRRRIDGPVYMRLLRGSVPVVLDPRTTASRSARRSVLREGSDVGIISTGLMTERALDAAAALARRGIAVGVLHVPTIKPFDADAVAAFAGVGRPARHRREPRRRRRARQPRRRGAVRRAASATPLTPDRPAGPLHRMRLGAAPAGAATGSPPNASIEAIAATAGAELGLIMKITGIETYAVGAGWKNWLFVGSTPTPASTASARAR